MTELSQSGGRVRGWLRIVVTGLIALCLGVPAIALAGPASATPSGRVIASPCLNMRSSANTSSAVLTCIPYNTTVLIDCTSLGSTVAGAYGNTAVWDHTTYAGHSGFVSDGYVYTGTNSRIAGDCAAPPSPPSSGRSVGLKANGNLGVAGQCTWGAYYQWHAATGYYPLISGNAKDWAASAAHNGWTVVLDAQVRSIVVFQPGVWGADRTYGHVGWVTSVSQRSDGRYITFIEMNGTAGPYNWDYRTVRDIVGMSYILAP